jgi:hypothetical protein
MQDDGVRERITVIMREDIDCEAPMAPRPDSAIGACFLSGVRSR